jgi:hypothetical protein
MSSSVNIASFQPLEDLEISLGRFSNKTREAISTVQKQIELKQEALDEIVRTRRRDVEMWQEAQDTADDEEDVSYIERKLRDAEDRLDEARNWQRRVEQVCGDFERRATEAAYLADEHSFKARLFLKERLRELYEYVALKPDAEVGLHSAGPAASGVAHDSNGVGDLAALSLPKGFGWISIDQLAPDDVANLPTEDDYKKDGLSAADMRAGLELLRTRILPEIQRNPEHATRDYFAELDIAENRSEPKNSLGEIFGAYFGSNYHMWFSRSKGDEYFRIGDGRHRIAAARELGWTVIPGQIQDGGR